jgi:hypothetical protein
METMTRLDLRTEVIHEAGIDGQTDSTGRHPETRLNALINRYCQSARSLTNSAAGEPWSQVVDAVQTIPAATAGEDFIELDFPTLAIGISGVDVLYNGEWRALDPASWAQRRLVTCDSPSGGAGFFAIKQLPEARASASVTGGKIAIWPKTLSGSYRTTCIEQWTPMTSDTHVLVGTADHFSWVINSCVMVCTKRDTNKREIFNEARLMRDEAEARIVAASKRVQRAGAVVPRRRGGELF